MKNIQVKELNDKGRVLTQRQLLIWTEQSLAPDLPANNMVMSFDLRGEIDVEHFKHAFAGLVDEVDVLRTTIVHDDRGPRQVVLDKVEHDLEFIDLADSPDAPKACIEWRNRRCVEVFDLGERLFDSALLRLGERHFVWYLCQHHLICDAWSFTLLFRRMSELYAKANGESVGSPLPPYTRHQQNEREYLGTDRATQAREFFDARFAEPMERLQLYGIDARNSCAASRRRELDLGDERCRRLRNMALEEDVRTVTPSLTLSLIFTTALYAYLHRVSGNGTIGIGSPVANRYSRVARQTPGLFMEVCPFRINIDENDSFASLLVKAEKEYTEVLPHSRYPVGNPIQRKRFDAMLNYHNAHIDDFAGIETSAELMTGLVALGALAEEDIGSALDFTWSAGDTFILQVIDFEGSGRFRLVFDLNADVFDEHQADRAVDHFTRLLDAFLDDRQQPVATAPLLDETEKREILSRGARQLEAEPKAGTLLDRFREVVARDPQRPAVSSGSKSLSYAELDAEIRSLATILRDSGLRPEDRAVVCIERSVEMLITLLAILDAGAAYVPIDPDHPVDRIRLILEDAAPNLIVTQSRLRDRVADSQAALLLFEPGRAPERPQSIQRHDGNEAVEPLDADRLAYVIFTSGSTGRPKGVEIEHPALTNFLTSMAKRPGLTEDDRLLAVTTVSFDIAALELFLPLTVGASVDIADAETCKDPRRMTARIESEIISVVQATPATWHMLVEHGFPKSKLRILCGGDALSRELADSLCEHSEEVWNLYGPTETTIWSSVERIAPANGKITIGYPIDRTVLRILNSAGEAVPDGVPGELMIGGAGLARGYCGRNDLTAERFVEDPYSDGRLYHSGDRARFLADGRIECLGRLDCQVKIRGFRIELGEIEAVLRNFDGVLDALVVARGESNLERQLAAYLRCSQSKEPDISAIARITAEKLPGYMQPTSYTLLDEFPLSPNGKVNREALPEPAQGARASNPSMAPLDDLEVALVSIWCDVLGFAEIARDDNFFDLGGNSIGAIGVLSRIERRFDYEISLLTFFKQPTIAGLASAIRGIAGSSSPGNAAPLEGMVELSPGDDDETPIFCIAGVHIYHAFARTLGPQYPVFGVYLGKERQWIEQLARGESADIPSTEEMAAEYITSIRQQQPSGPYRLAGLSYGGVIAYEMSRQLSQIGEQVEALILFDVRLHWRIAMSGGTLLRARHHARRFLPRMKGRYALRDKSSHFEKVRDVMSLEALETYEQRMQPYSGNALLIRALDEPASRLGNIDSNLGWSDLIQDELLVVDVPGDHLSILSAENVENMREAIESYLDAARRARKAPASNEKSTGSELIFD